MANPSDQGPGPRTNEAFADLATQIRAGLPPAMGTETWYLLITAVLTSAPDTSLVGQFYRWLATQSGEFASAEARAALHSRLGDVLAKLMTVVGGPRVLCVLMDLVKVEKELGVLEDGEEQKKGGREVGIQEVEKQGTDALARIYGSDLLPQVFAGFGVHRGRFEEVMRVPIYGHFLGDFEVLSPLETESVVFAAITCTGLRSPSLWHMRGLGRVLGARGGNDEVDSVRKVKDVLRSVKIAVMGIVEFVGPDMVKSSGLESELGWVNVGDVNRDLGGWGSD